MSFLSLSTDPVTEAYPDQPLAVSVDSTVGEVIELMRAQRGSCVLVCADDDCQGKVLGIFTERDALRWMAQGAAAQIGIRDWMTANPTVIDAKSSVGSAIQAMSAGGYRHLPIVDETGTPKSVISVRGLVHYLVDHFPNTIYTLPPEPGKTYDREGA
ncbi:MAG: CBS domain-containing protein [Planctomycetota bacterium]|nr:MAG: CBS domain-containing protein [Planctomycetota bacterium]